MFVRKKPNKSGSTSVQIVDKSSGNYKIIETIGSSKEKVRVDFFIRKAYQRISELHNQEELPLLTTLAAEEIVKNYRELWQIEKAFRISKTDLKVRPIYHRLQDRIQAHLSIAFAAYTIYKELERLLRNNNIALSGKRAIELTETIYTLDVQLPDSRTNETIVLKSYKRTKATLQND